MLPLLKSRTFQTVVGFAVSIGLIVWMFSGIEWGEFKELLGTVRYVVFLPALFLFWIHFFLRAVRWRYLLAGGEGVSLRTLFDGIAIGNFATYILPLRAGEFIRPWIVARQSSSSFSNAFSSVVIERFFDLGMVLISFGLVLPFLSNVHGWVYQGAYALTFLAVAIFGFIVICVFLPDFALRIADLFLRFLPSGVAAKIRRFLEEFLGGARTLRKGKNIAFVIGLSLPIWITNFVLLTVFLAMLPGIPVEFLIGTTVGVILAFAVAAPSAPGFLGVYQTGCVAAFELFGVAREPALVYAIVTHLFQYIVIVLYGMWALTRMNLSVKDLVKRQEQVL